MQPTSVSKRHHLFEALELVRNRPGMYLGGSGDRDDQLRTPEILLAGYELALDVNCVDEPGRRSSARFAAFVAMETNWSMSCGVVAAIVERMHGEEAWSKYWNLVDAFRRNA